MKPLGILGGGQLARMMALKAHEIGVEVHILSADAHDPAAQVVRHWHQGALDDPRALGAFLKTCKTVTFESEFLDASLLAGLARKSRTHLHPSAEVMGLVQDRLTQKQLLDEYDVPTASWMAVENSEQAQAAFGAFDGRVVFKKRRFGYDGYGTFVVRSAAELKAFIKKQLPRDEGEFIAEELIAFSRELAVMLARSKTGQTQVLPLVETRQRDSRCLWVKGPIKPRAKDKAMIAKTLELLKSLDYVGVMGVELFATDDDVLVNELAPRVHNSGHYSLEALSVDQFSLHVRAVLGEDLGIAQLLKPGFAMYNLLGSKSASPKWTLPAEAAFHWYGKRENRRGRKMGHLTALGSSPELALELAQKARLSFDL